MSQHVAVRYLRSLEWSMGASQCPECCGKHPNWYGHPCARTPDLIGHKLDCSLAAALRSLGDTPVMLGEYEAGPEQMHWRYRERSTA